MKIICDNNGKVITREFNSEEERKEFVSHTEAYKKREQEKEREASFAERGCDFNAYSDRLSRATWHEKGGILNCGFGMYNEIALKCYDYLWSCEGPDDYIRKVNFQISRLEHEIENQILIGKWRRQRELKYYSYFLSEFKNS